MDMERVWAMPNRWTFTIKPIRELLEEEVDSRDLWLDPFCGNHTPVGWSYCNDILPDIEAKYHMDALEWLSAIRGRFADGIVYDPPYSITQARKYGRKEYANMKYWASCKNEIGRIVKPGGKAICCGWSSNGIGKGRGFELKRILLVAHGGSKNDTIVTVEVKNGTN